MWELIPGAIERYLICGNRSSGGNRSGAQTWPFSRIGVWSRNPWVGRIGFVGAGSKIWTSSLLEWLGNGRGQIVLSTRFFEFGLRLGATAD